MTTQEVANKFYEMSQKGDRKAIQDELYADNCVSIEPDFAPMPITEGLEAIKAKGIQFNEMVEEKHNGYCNQPIVAGNHFSCTMGMDVTMKETGRTQMNEVCVYEVKKGKIVKEQFFYAK